MFSLPLFHRFEDRECLVIGGGVTALRKLRWLVRTGASVTVIAPEIAPEIVALQEHHNLRLVQQIFTPEALHEDFVLTICATNAEGVSEQAHSIAIARGQWINCVDRTDLCNVIFPAIVDRWPILVAVSSMGQSPTLSRTVRGWLEQRLPMGLGKLADLAGRLRNVTKERLPDVDTRKAFWEQIFSGPAADAAIKNDLDQAEQLALRQLQQSQGKALAGRLVLVGAGPGDADLITLRGLRAIQSADVLLYDKLANPDLLNYARRDAELIDVGKQGPRDGDDNVPRRGGTEMQQQINALILEAAHQGKTVVRLKGGDPYIFGRGGEEQLIAQQANIEFEVIPGVTAAMGAASYCGIPLTHRGHSQSVRFVTGHRVEQSRELDWPELARSDQTLVIYMGLVGIEKILGQLIAAGRSANTPAVLIENATLNNQRAVFASLDGLALAVAREQVTGPSIIIVGEVVALAPDYPGH
ncbi:MAG: siroheme synthase CysG [Pseudomonadota bacterium]|nr:siroheme synthase CysG [Pseudomonadota bacterium]